MGRAVGEILSTDLSNRVSGGEGEIEGECDNPVQVLRPRSWNFRLRKGLPPLTVRSGGKGRGGLEELEELKELEQEENHEKQKMQEEKLENEEYHIFLSQPGGH